MKQSLSHGEGHGAARADVRTARQATPVLRSDDSRGTGPADPGPLVSQLAAGLLASLPGVRTVAERGRVVQAFGTTLRVSGLSARIGQQCQIGDAQGPCRRAEVVGLAHGDAVLVPLDGLQGIAADAPVQVCAEQPLAPFGPGLLGRILDGAGQPLDGRPLPDGLAHRPLASDAPNPLQRVPIAEPFPTGVRAIDSALTVGVGQRLGIFATAGGGKSTLLGMLARRAASDVNVIALIGERGREVREFIEDSLGDDGLARSVLVVSTSDRPSMERLRAAQLATAIAEGFRAQGARVLLMMDSATRFARAMREIGLSIGEPAVRRGYPPSVFAELPRLFERAGNDDRGSITAFYTVLAEDEDGSDPIAEELRSILDGHIVLSRELGQAGHYPAIDVLASASRVFNRVTTPAHRADALRLRALMAKHAELKFLLQVGEYRAGSDALGDEAIARWPGILGLLRQSADEPGGWHDTLQRLHEVLA